MTFSFTLVLGLFLLAPGFAVFAAIYHGSRLGPVESPPPPPGSILALSVVTVGALLAHLLGAAVFWGQDLVCAQARLCRPVDYDANVYAALFNIAGGKGRVSGLEVVAVLLTLGVLTAVAFLATRRAAPVLAGRRGFKTVLYGWLADVAVAASDDEAVLAYVLSDVEEDGTVVGYEGVVANMTANAEKEITSILLTSCETFYLRVTQAGVTRRKAARTNPIPQLYLDRAHIKNVAFERVRFEDA